LVAKTVGVLVGVVLAAGLTVVPSALAAGPPEWPEPPTALVVHSTRVILEMTLRSEKLTTKWKSEYAPICTGMSCLASECEQAVPMSGWKTVNESIIQGESSAQSNRVLLGAPDPEGGPIQLRHLSPETCYVVRFSAINSDSKLDQNNEPEPAERDVWFRTRPIEKPEVPKLGSMEEWTEPAFILREAMDDGVVMSAKIESNGAESSYVFEYASPEKGGMPSVDSSSWKAFSSGSGNVSVAEDYANVIATTTGLAPESTYYVRIRLTNEKGTVFQDGYREGESLVTGTTKPGRPELSARNITESSARLAGSIQPHGSQSGWRFEVASAVSGECPGESNAGWSVVPGGEGVVGRGQAESMGYGESVPVGVTVTGLRASTTYCARLRAENANGVEVSDVSSFVTEGPPSVVSFAVHRLVGESVEFMGTLNPKSVATSEEQTVTVNGASGGTFTLTVGGETTVPIAFDAPASGPGSVESALKRLSGEPQLTVEGVTGGPYTVFFGGPDAGSSEPLIAADGSGLIPASSGSVSVLETQGGGESTAVHYWFQYVTSRDFEEHGWADPEETGKLEAGSGVNPAAVGIVVPGLVRGGQYRFRLVAEGAVGGLIIGSEEQLVVPVAPAVGGGGACPNSAFRVGLSVALPDCRAYEQVTPIEKGAAQEPFHYRGGIESALLVGEDGEHAVLEAPEVDYGSSATSGQSPYLFSRGEGGWAMTAGAPQPESGLDSAIPQVYSDDLTEVAFESAYSPSHWSESPEVEYKVGPIGGPYKKVISVPRVYVHEAEESGGGSGWVAGNRDLSTLVLETRDHELLGGETGTKSGSDLYEYAASGGLKQLNVTGSGEDTVTIGSCGAKMVDGEEDLLRNHTASSTRSVSSDGSRIFFQAVPGRNCSEAPHLYMRHDGSETVNIGAYAFVAANPEGTRLLLRSGSGELVGYNVEAGSFESRSASEVAEDRELEALGVPVRFVPEGDTAFARPRYTFWTPPAAVGGQASRYDDVEHVVECISCASSFDPAPKDSAYMGDAEGLPYVSGGLPDFEAASANGEFAFFTTISALVPQDIDQEILPEFDGDSGEYVNVGGHASPSTDVYEWRAGGVDGCGAVQGCLALITDGRGGYLNLFLGSADEGRDVFIYTRSTLSPEDKGAEGGIGEGNVYDVRMDGGFAPPPPRPTECEGDACSTPPPPPVDVTPSSLTFAGSGNVLAPPATAVKPAPKPKSKPKKGCDRKGKQRCKPISKRPGAKTRRARARRTRGDRRGA
jgi:hypothetical protein